MLLDQVAVELGPAIVEAVDDVFARSPFDPLVAGDRRIDFGQ